MIAPAYETSRMPIIDAHQHIWDPARADYSAWLGPDLGDLNRAVRFEELAPMLAAAGVERTVLVQAADNAEDTALMLEVADRHPQVAAVVGWVPLDRPAEAARALDALAGHPAFRGVRPGIHFMPDPDWLLRPDVGQGLALLEERGISLDVVSVRRRHLQLVPLLSERHPRLRMVIDHLSKPPVRKPDWEPWRTNLVAAAENPLVYAKVSGIFPARGPMAEWDADVIRPYVDLALEHFGPARLMFGSDWPICDLAGGFPKVWREYNRIFDTLAPPDRALLLGGTAAEFYRIEEEPA